MTKLNNLLSGQIIGIPLNHNLGYIFAKIVNLMDFAELDLSKTFHFLIYPFDYIEKDLNSFSLTKFQNSEPLTGGIFVIDIQPVVNKNKWKIVGQTDLLDYEKRIPDFRGFNPIFAKYENEATSWRYYQKGLATKWILAEYEAVEHLENNTAYSHDLIEKRLSMEILRQSNNDIEKFYELKEWKDLSVYYNMLYTKPFRKIPNSMKGKVNNNNGA
ncbi:MULTISPECIES: Imm26 family immunity protein [Flavobacterium]|uniref:Imm26 family immunity protein n=1 Tax=Flavobacterium TaxID=237 RepID=UPI001FCA5288|nr:MULTISPECIES: Imm26 family immunity protein [Flavobacterium]UOK41636.1 immunity 26/phosphotriesterase HocA family protein [Flavobacterium enshiense]